METVLSRRTIPKMSSKTSKSPGQFNRATQSDCRAMSPASRQWNAIGRLSRLWEAWCIAGRLR
eukprot:1106162-Amorphochlora_amoeboformis.AAC.1